MICAAHPTIHSVRCPSVGARIAVEGLTLVYSADVVAFEDPEAALSGADFYVGDGSTLTGSLVRRHSSGVLIGHTTVRAQLGWLARHGILRAAFSHFGKDPIAMGEEALAEALGRLAAANPPGCAVTAASDGLELEVGCATALPAGRAAQPSGERVCAGSAGPVARRATPPGSRASRLRGRRGAPRPNA